MTVVYLHIDKHELEPIMREAYTPEYLATRIDELVMAKLNVLADSLVESGAWSEPDAS